MNKPISWFLVFLFLLLVPTGYLFYKHQLPTKQDLKRSESSSGENGSINLQLAGVKLDVEVARTPQQIQQGLGQRESIEENHAMLFDFPKKNITPAFWMKDMLFPIDIIWIDEGKIVGIERDVPAPKPGSLDNELPLYYSPQPIDYVLEVRAGFSEAHQLKIGDSILIP